MPCRAAGRREGLRSFPLRLLPRSACPRSNWKRLCADARFFSEDVSVPSIGLRPFHRTCWRGNHPLDAFFVGLHSSDNKVVVKPICLIVSRCAIPCPVRTSTCRNFVTISSGLGRLLDICFLRFPKQSGGPIQWGRIRVCAFSVRRTSLPRTMSRVLPLQTGIH